MAICAALGEYMMGRNSGKIKVKRDANGRLVQIGGDKETVRVKAI